MSSIVYIENSSRIYFKFYNIPVILVILVENRKKFVERKCNSLELKWVELSRLYVCEMYYLRDGARSSFISADPENTFRSILLISFKERWVHSKPCFFCPLSSSTLDCHARLQIYFNMKNEEYINLSDTFSWWTSLY